MIVHVCSPYVVRHVFAIIAIIIVHWQTVRVIRFGSNLQVPLQVHTVTEQVKHENNNKPGILNILYQQPGKMWKHQETPGNHHKSPRNHHQSP